MLDLDEVMERYVAWYDPAPVEGGLDDIEIEVRTWKSANDVPALVVELRAARRVISETRRLLGTAYFNRIPTHVVDGRACACPPEAHPLASAMVAYDRVAGEVSGR